MLKHNITGTLGSQICAYWRAALSYSVNETRHQYSTQWVAEHKTIVVPMSGNDYYIGESSLEDVEIIILAPYVFGYCEEHAENENYEIYLGEGCIATYVYMYMSEFCTQINQ